MLQEQPVQPLPKLPPMIAPAAEPVVDTATEEQKSATHEHKHATEEHKSATHEHETTGRQVQKRSESKHIPVEHDRNDVVVSRSESPRVKRSFLSKPLQLPVWVLGLVCLVLAVTLGWTIMASSNLRRLEKQNELLLKIVLERLEELSRSTRYF